MMKDKNLPAWGGAFSVAHSQDAYRFTASIDFDNRLYKYDIMGSKAHARMLAHTDIISADEAGAIIGGLEEIEKRIEAGQFEWHLDREDLHMNIESALINLIGAPGEKLHTARSRNDQVVLDVRLWMRDQVKQIQTSIRNLQLSLLEICNKHRDIVIPGYTHLQRAQPVLLAHHWLAYVEMFQRDSGRFADTWKRAGISPLGSGAVAGTTLPIDREFVARELGFLDEDGTPLVTQNSIDAVSDRDFIIEFLSACALTSLHLSQMSEELVIWSSSEFAFLKIGDAFCTGSSLMPQKKNPDIPEIIRGKTGRVYGNLVSLLVTMKGLALSYNYDMQEDKEALFDSSDTIMGCLNIMKEVLDSLSFNRDNCAKAASDPLLLTTDLVDYLVMKQIPFRSAHHIVGNLVAKAMEKNIPITAIPPSELLDIHPLLTVEAMQVFNLSKAVKARVATGAPSEQNVEKRIRFWKNYLS